MIIVSTEKFSHFQAWRIFLCKWKLDTLSYGANIEKKSASKSIKKN